MFERGVAVSDVICLNGVLMFGDGVHGAVYEGVDSLRGVYERVDAFYRGELKKLDASWKAMVEGFELWGKVKVLFGAGAYLTYMGCGQFSVVIQGKDIRGALGILEKNAGSGWHFELETRDFGSWNKLVHKKTGASFMVREGRLESDGTLRGSTSAMMVHLS